eukprot:CAMPEP_0116965622 /NCGR_PEP_ID=MMETSP0467-20121206/49331_1 /TAXON_ID=283647 /ORGANISM="Mesodinium pulex, Strain SPMC105" /LENGTH=207 /DNA_ID=CAMNT_0004654907 /DNA_START=333 /DNA_END=956 /DNA_ORIENTATION=-
MKRFRWSLFKTLEFLNSRRNDIDLKPSYLNQLSGLEGRLFKDEKSKTSKWDDFSSEDIDECVIKNTYLNSQMSQFADYSNLQNKMERRKMRWLDEEGGGKTNVEITGVAASTKDSLSFMISSVRPMNRLVEQSHFARGPFNPAVFQQPLKLKSVLKGSKEKYQIITPTVLEKSKRPMSCGGVRYRNGNTTMNTNVNLNHLNANINGA